MKRPTSRTANRRKGRKTGPNFCERGDEVEDETHVHFVRRPPCGIATALSAEQVCVSIAMRLRWLSGYAEANKLGLTGSH
jgi:hypothetical protein